MRKFHVHSRRSNEIMERNSFNNQCRKWRVPPTAIGFYKMKGSVSSLGGKKSSSKMKMGTFNRSLHGMPSSHYKEGTTRLLKSEDESGKSLKPKHPVETIRRIMATEPRALEAKTSSSLKLTASNLTPSMVLDILAHAKTSQQAYSFFQWAHRNGFRHNIETYFKMLEILGRARKLNVARNLLFGMTKNGVNWEDNVFNSLIRSYGRVGLMKESVKLFKRMNELGIRPTVLSYNNLFTVLLKRGRTNMVKAYYKTMIRDGLLPNVVTYNILIRGFCLSSKIDEAYGFFNEMMAQRCSPDIITYNTLLDGLCRTGRLREAHDLLKYIRGKKSDLNPTVVTYTTMIRGYCGKQRIDEALRVFNEMVGQGVRPNEITYNVLIQGLCEANKLEETHKIIQEMVQSNFKPDACTFNTLMNAQCKAGKLEEALVIFEKMAELNVHTDSATYSVLIRSLCSRGKFDKAVELVDDLLQKGILLEPGGCTPLVAAYNPMFEYLCRHGESQKAEKLFRQLLRRGTQDPAAFKTVILGLSKDSMPEAGFELLKIMVWRSFCPDVDTCYALLNSFLHKGQLTNARDTLDKMLESGHIPTASTFHTLIDMFFRNGRIQTASSVMKTMLENDVRQNIDLSTNVLSGLFDHGFIEEAFEHIESLYNKGYTPHMDKLIDNLCQKCKYSESQRLLLFILYKDCYLNVASYNSVLNGLCTSGKAMEAFLLFCRMTEKGRMPDPKCYEALVTSLQAEGKLEQAEFISRRLVYKSRGSIRHTSI